MTADPIISDLGRILDGFEPEIALILGSGLGFFAEDRVDVYRKIPYTDIPGFPASTAPGHAGNLVAGTCGGRKLVCYQGRFHFYEGYAMEQVVLPARVAGGLGATRLLVTNAAGGIGKGLRPGDLMLIRDHINFMGVNPLRGPNVDAHGPRFPDMTEVYTPGLRELAREVAETDGLELKEGVYLACPGPSYETPAEIRAFQTLGADAVGMSTVPEAVVARHMGMEVLGISCITNYGAGLGDGLLYHGEVEETAAKVRGSFADLLEGILKRLPESP